MTKQIISLNALGHFGQPPANSPASDISGYRAIGQIPHVMFANAV
jgi:hypothetical protein